MSLEAWLDLWYEREIFSRIQRDPVGSDGSIQYLRLGKIKGDDEGRKVVEAIVIEKEAKSGR